MERSMRGLIGAEMAIRTANTIQKGSKKVINEVDRESRRAAESQGRITITVGAVPPLAISISPEGGPESGPLSLSSLDDLSTLRETLGLPDGESSPEEADDDDKNGPERLFWIPLDVESPPNSLRPLSPAAKPPPPASELVFFASAPEPVSSASAPEPVSSTTAPEPSFPASAPASSSIPGHYAVLAGRSPWKPRSGRNV
jgi:hypothetical protein